MSEPTMTSEAGTPPIVTLEMPPSLTNPVPVIITTVPGQAPPPAVTSVGTAAFPPTQLVIVTAPADPAATRPNATSTERQNAVLGDTRVEPLPLTREPSLLG